MEDRRKVIFADEMSIKVDEERTCLVCMEGKGIIKIALTNGNVLTE